MIGKDILKAKQFLEAGDAVAIPTETVYGLAANAFSPEAIIGIYEIKERPRFNPLIVHINSMEKISALTTDFPPELMQLAMTFWPGPLTILLPRSAAIHPVITAGSDLVALRIPNHSMTLELLAALDFPLCAPSANPFGYISPTTALHVEQQLGNKIPYILDGGSCSVGVESTIIKFNHQKKIEILRTGGISAEQISALTGEIPFLRDHAVKPEAPGMLFQHYAPHIPLYFTEHPEQIIEQHKNKKIRLLTFKTTIHHPSIIQHIVLSAAGSLQEAATTLFAALHALDMPGADILIAEQVPDTGIGKAINDRLRRAAAKNI